MPRKPRRATDAPTPETAAFLDRLLAGFAAEGRVGAALGEAARWGHLAYLRAELDRGVPADTPTENGGTALMYAASGGQQAALRLLLDAGADPNARDAERGMTPLLWNLAALHRPEVYVACCRLLLDRGADPNARAADGSDARRLAGDRDDRGELLDLLRAYGATDAAP